MAVARTSDVAGGMVASGAGPAFKVESACVAVSTLTLQSVDTVPGMDTSQRDGTIADVLAALRFPVATFKTRQPLPVAGGDDGRKHQLKVVGEFTVHGATRVVTATLEAVILGRRAEVVGSFPIKLRDYGMAPPENPIAAVDSTVTIELHVFLDRT